MSFHLAFVFVDMNSTNCTLCGVSFAQCGFVLLCVVWCLVHCCVRCLVRFRAVACAVACFVSCAVAYVVVLLRVACVARMLLSRVLLRGAR
jgi:hypothetical protein